MKLRNRRELGEGQIGCLIGVIFLLLGALVAYRMVPIKIKAAEMRDTVKDEAKSAGTHNDNQIRKTIIATADRLQLPLKDSDVKVERKSGNIYVEVKYTVPVEFPGYVYQWNFVHTAENPIF